MTRSMTASDFATSGSSARLDAEPDELEKSRVNYLALVEGAGAVVELERQAVVGRAVAW